MAGKKPTDELALLKEDSSRRLSAVEERLTKLEQGFGELQKSLGDLAKAKEAAAATPDSLYQQGQELFKAGEVVKARERFTSFLEKYPTHQLAANARFWLGETYYSIHDIFQEEKLQVFQDLLAPNQKDALDAITHSFGETRPLLKAMAVEGLPLPRLYRALGEITLNRRLVELLRTMEPDPASISASEEILTVIADARLMGLKLETHEGAEILGRILHRRRRTSGKFLLHL